MREFNYSQIRNQKWDSELLSLIAAIYKEAGKQELYLKQRPQELEKLVEIAKIQSTEASNAIEGIVTTSTRIRQLVEEKTTPHNRDEQEIAGYDSKQYTCSVTERVCPFFDVIVSFIFQCFLSALVRAAKGHFYFFLKARVIFFLIGWVFFLNQFSFDEGGADSRSALIDFIKNSFI